MKTLSGRILRTPNFLTPGVLLFIICIAGTTAGLVMAPNVLITGFSHRTPSRNGNYRPVNYQPAVLLNAGHGSNNVSTGNSKNGITSISAQDRMENSQIVSGFLTREQDPGVTAYAIQEMFGINPKDAIKTLISLLTSTQDSKLKAELCLIVASVRNPDLGIDLLDAYMQSSDSEAVSSAFACLVHVANNSLINEIVSRYASSGNLEERGLACQLIAGLKNPDGIEALIRLAEDPAGPDNEPLLQASIYGLTSIGTAPAADYILERLEAGARSNADFLASALSRICNPAAQSALIYAALGNKEAQSARTQAAAIQALANYPNQEVISLLEELAAGNVPEVSQAATESLDRIRRR